jgi:ankyrin repeat protein
VTKLLAEGADTNALSRRGRTALLLAVMQDRRNVAEALLLAGADPCLHGHGGWPALVWAVSQEKIDYVRLILTRAARQPSQDCLDEALKWSIITANTEAIRLLAEHNANVDHRALERAERSRGNAVDQNKPKFQRVIELLRELGVT